MDKDIKILIVPDVHCREFWKAPVKSVLSETDAKIVFLGDYVDGYKFEWDDNFDYKTLGVNNFKEIIELKKQYPNRITLLLGNHDCTYALGDDICNCRTDYTHKKELEDLFIDNKERFQIAKEEIINGKHFIFSHAGMLRKYFTLFFKDIDWDKVNPVDFFNNAWVTDNYQVTDKLGIIDRCRGWCMGNKYGSPVWSDIRMWEDVKPEDTFGFNIVGHTQLAYEPIMFDTIACLDCRRCFYINSNADIVEYDTDKIVQKTEKPTD